MRLKHIKLAGFKSFVDPTKVPFEQQMTAIVGPNGCGKSNIIDAVRWVLGESSAKNLRGDAMTDVIFNGAASRKPIGQASVELVFDNMSGHIQGTMADRNQISIRRVVNRESQNTYYLNGTKCRRKDITDIFLGTGLGPRSYAIIEQGTISRLIESKPQELRVFIEEAAGISKYKERRRDTENRIRHTRENLTRLTDIRVELNVQIDKLHQQAESAKRFKTLKGQERKIKAELAVMRWKKFDQQHQENNHKAEVLSNSINEKERLLATDDIVLSTAKENMKMANEKVQRLQQNQLRLINQTARLEQEIKHQKAQQSKLAQDKEVLQSQLAQAQQSLLLEQNQLVEQQRQHDALLPEFKQLTDTLAETEHSLKVEQKQLNEQQHLLHVYHQNQSEKNAKTSALHQEKATHQSSIEHNNIQLKQVKSELEQLTSKEKTTADANEKNVIEIEIDAKEKLLKNNTLEQKKLSHEIEALTISFNRNAGTYQSLQSQISHLTQKIETQSSWELSQQHWLNQRGHKSQGKFFQSLTIEKGWEQAVEIALSHLLKGELIESIEHVIGQLSDHYITEKLQESVLPEKLLLVNQHLSGELVPDSLASKITSDNGVLVALNAIKTAENIEQAKSMLPALAPHESVICPQGFWISKQFIRKGMMNDNPTVLEDKTNLAQLTLNEGQLKNEQVIIEHELKDKKAQHLAIMTQATQLKDELACLREQVNELTQARLLKEHEHQLEQALILKLNQEKSSIETRIQQANESLVKVMTQLKALENSPQSINGQENSERSDIDDLTITIQASQANIASLQQQQKSYSDKKHQSDLKREKSHHLLLQQKQNITRFQESINHLIDQQNQHKELLENNINPLENDDKQLKYWLDELSAIDHQLTSLQKEAAETQNKISDIEQTQKKTVESINQLKGQVNQIQLDGEGYRLKAQSALEQLKELANTPEDVLANMPNNARESQWQAQLIRLTKDIQMLGAINLAAIDEFETQLERKNYLDQQDQDLNLAITTLESAIEKIDKESRQKFKETFDKVNRDLQSLFPKVFGGGQAYLSLLGDDMLDTGVTIMARPPGKKNSTIHLLSGGEKALTALSLVFAIFRLNPAPFCMLDEVDAPLDDANVSRFCKLVKEMSQTVQFIYISHNKIAMEMASHLTGVTMFEAGVSKMVAVDIDEAIAMAEVS